MLNKIIAVIVAVALFQVQAISQKAVFRAEISMGTFNMNDLKVLQNSRDPYLNVDLKTTGFPAYWGYGLSVMSFLKSGFGIGITSELYSTGGSNYYADYSGSYNYELLAKAVNLGIISSFKTRFADRHSIQLEVSQGIKYSNLIEKERLFIYRELYNTKKEFQSQSYWLKPLVRYDYSFSSAITAGAYFGGEFNPQSYLQSIEDDDVYLTDSNQHKISINWSGIRFGFHFSINILK